MKGPELKIWRETNGFTQAALSEAIGISRQTISAWERSDDELPKVVVLALRYLASIEAVAGRRMSAPEYRELRNRPHNPGTKAARKTKDIS